MDTQSAVQAAVAPADLPSTELDEDTYTLRRLKHCTAEHLNLTTRRCFIGPIPEGWLRSHRRDWYKHHLNLHYSTQSPSFRANASQGRHRRLTGLDGPSVLASRGKLSFPQPDDAIDEEDDENAEDEQVDDDPQGDLVEQQLDRIETGEGEAPATLDEPPALPVPRATALGDDDIHKDATVNEDVPDEGERAIDNVEQPKRLTPPSALLHRKSSGRPKASRQTSNSSWHTAAESIQHSVKSKRLVTVEESESPSRNDSQTMSPRTSGGPDSLTGNQLSNDPSSRTSLINHGTGEAAAAKDDAPKGILAKIKDRSALSRSDGSQVPARATDDPIDVPGDSNRRTSTGLVRFNLPGDEIERQQHMKVRVAQLRQRRTFKRIARGTVRDGEIIKMEHMLVRVEFTTYEMPKEFNENDSPKVESRLVEKWKEYMVVCRERADDDIPFVLQLYKSRVIPSVDHRGKKRYAHEIQLSKQQTNINVYSALDKTIVVWVPKKKGTLIYIMQARAGANSMEWFTFLRNVLGWNRTAMLEIKVPDLDLSLRLEKPFQLIEQSAAAAQAKGADDEAIIRTMRAEQAISGAIIDRCLEMLLKSPEWASIIDTWAGGERMGLAWKRYDRLEWVHGANEKKMYGTIGMEKSYDLELRPKQHYPTSVVKARDESGHLDMLIEPPPVEGFLVRLTSARSMDQKLGRLFFKRLYFSTHNQFLAFNRPARADPPPPPRMPMQQDNKIPTAVQIAEKTPLIYSVNPFPLDESSKKVSWLLPTEPSNPSSVSSEPQLTQQERDSDAYDEDERKNHLLLRCDGIIDLTQVKHVRHIRPGSSKSTHLDTGSDVDFDASVPDTALDDGTTSEVDDDRTFELTLKNGTSLRLQAFDRTTMREWIHRLRQLTRYWTRRAAADIAEYRAVRHANLARLNIDDEAEAIVGQHSDKWQVAHAVASPSLHHICNIAGCRAVRIAGTLFRKTRLHANFERVISVLAHGQLLTFRATPRARLSGAAQPSPTHERIAALDLRDCYIYSGGLAADELLYTAQNYDGNRTGRRALPRLYGADGWSSVDEPESTCFVVWHGRRKTLFRKEVDGNDSQKDKWWHSGGAVEGRKLRGAGRSKSVVKKVSSLGVQGRSIVFQARSRAERDRWVMSIGLEIERLSAGGSDVRVTD